MNRKHSLRYILVITIICAAGLQAAVLFDDDFNVDGNLNGQSPDVGGNWSVTSGSLTNSGGAVDTYNTSIGMKLAFASFSQALGAGDTLTLTFQTVNTAGSFDTFGWVGLSLYTGGSGGTEEFFFGSPGTVAGWGMGGGQTGDQSVVPGQTTEAATGVFTYAYDTGNYTFSVAGGSLSGTVDANLALNTVRIGADINNLASMAVSDINIRTGGGAATPEPTTFAMMGLAFFVLIAVRTRCCRTES